MTTISLVSENIRAVVDPKDGNRLTSIQAYGNELLLSQTPSPMGWGSIVMVPFAGRISNGVINFEGTTYRLPTTFGSHAIHGYGYTSPWLVKDTTAYSVTSTWAFSDPWPWRGHAEYTIRATTSGLLLQLTATALERQPLSIGFHPWFKHNVAGHSHKLSFDPKEMYKTVDSIPNGDLVTPSQPPWDDCFRLVSDNPNLSWGDLTLTFKSNTDHWVVYNQRYDTICIEPQTGPPNEANNNPRVFDPGEKLFLEASLNFDRS